MKFLISVVLSGAALALVTNGDRWTTLSRIPGAELLGEWPERLGLTALWNGFTNAAAELWSLTQTEGLGLYHFLIVLTVVLLARKLAMWLLR